MIRSDVFEAAIICVKIEKFNAQSGFDRLDQMFHSRF